MRKIIDGFEKLYKSRQSVKIHLSLFAICGILSIISTYLQLLKDAKALPAVSVSLLMLITVVILGAYLFGYCLKLTHNSFDGESEILPEIDKTPFWVFWNVLPLSVVWSLYCTLAIILLAATSIVFNTGLLIAIPALTILAVFCIIIFAQFIFVAYSKDFEKQGLFNIALPFKYMKSTWKELLLLVLKFIPFAIASVIPSFVAGFIFGFMGSFFNLEHILSVNLIIYVGAILGGYFGFVVQLVWYYRLVQVYKEKIEQTEE